MLKMKQPESCEASQSPRGQHFSPDLTLPPAAHTLSSLQPRGITPFRPRYAHLIPPEGSARSFSFLTKRQLHLAAFIFVNRAFRLICYF